MASAYIALGSNLGDRAGTLLAAVRELNGIAGIRVVRLSTFHETAPVGGPPNQPRFLNAAAEIATSLAPDELLAALLQIEHSRGRERGEKNAPRTLDLDILLYDHLVRPSPDPILPHPRMHERAFVLAPLVEIARDVIHPVLGKSIDVLFCELMAATPAEQPAASAQPAGDLFSLRGLRTLVTGATSGIGRAIALAFARAGADVIVHGRDAERASQVATEIQALGLTATSELADLSKGLQYRQFADRVWAQSQGLNVCVLNAGADILTGAAASWPFERKMAEVFAIDVASTVLLGRDFGERMRMQGHGVILTMSWDQAESGMEGDTAQLFGAAKGAVAGFTRSLAVSLAPQVRVNALAPGWIRTAWGTSASSRWQERVERETPLGRWGTPEDVAAAAVWLASPAATFITGQVIRVNGGAVR